MMIGEKIAAARKEQGLTQERLAKNPISPSFRITGNKENEACEMKKYGDTVFEGKAYNNLSPLKRILRPGNRSAEY